MGKVSDYKAMFQEACGITDPAERKSKIEVLLEEYRKDSDIKSLTMTSESQTKAVTDLEFKMYAEKEMPHITEAQTVENNGLLVKYFRLIFPCYKTSPFKVISLDRARRKNMLTQKDLMIQFTV